MTTQAKAATAAKPARSLRYDDLSGMLRIQVGRAVDAYSLHVLPSAEGVTQVALHKFGADQETRYIVTAAGDAVICSCPAGKWGKPCKHVGAIVKLIETGAL